VVNAANELYAEAIAAYGARLSRLARGYEADPDRRRDLLQEIHIGLWRSLSSFEGRCSLQTWVYRVAHNVAASHIVRSRRAQSRLVELDTLEEEPCPVDGQAHADRRHAAARLLEMVHRLKPLDRQIILLYLEGEQAAAIAEVMGLSAVNIATKIHRIKKLLGRQFQEGDEYAGR
jgi:RNA polymerase sigma-70 factor (ECF subfamily)